MLKIHLRSTANGRTVTTFCGRYGMMDRNTSDEFTTMDGTEARLDITTEERNATCATCLTLCNKAKRKQWQYLG